MTGKEAGKKASSNDKTGPTRDAATTKAILAAQMALAADQVLLKSKDILHK